LIVAHYEVVGRVFQKQPVPQGTIDWLLALARPYTSQGLRVRSSLRDGAIFNAFSHHFVVGFYEPDVVKAPVQKNVLKFFGSFWP
jgi:hypothetical protein